MIGVFTRPCQGDGQRLEAPPGFEPGVEVLQAGPKNVKLLTRFAFWSALIPRFTPFSAGFVPTLFPSRFFPQVVDLRSGFWSFFDRFVPVLFRACAQLLDREIARRFMGTDWKQIWEQFENRFEKEVDTSAQDLRGVRSSQFPSGRWRRSHDLSAHFQASTWVFAILSDAARPAWRLSRSHAASSRAPEAPFVESQPPSSRADASSPRGPVLVPRVGVPSIRGGYCSSLTSL